MHYFILLNSKSNTMNISETSLSRKHRTLDFGVQITDAMSSTSKFQCFGALCIYTTLQFDVLRITTRMQHSDLIIHLPQEIASPVPVYTGLLRKKRWHPKTWTCKTEGHKLEKERNFICSKTDWEILLLRGANGYGPFDQLTC